MANKIVLFVFVAFAAQGAFAESTKEEDLLSEFFSKLINNTYPITNPQAVTDCFSMHSQSFSNLGNRLETMMDVAAAAIVKNFGETQYEQRMKNISNKFKMLSELIWPHVLKRNFQKALEEANKIAVTVNEVANELVKELRKKNRPVFNKAVEEFNKIKVESKRKSRFITVSVKNCIQKGGPYGNSK